MSMQFFGRVERETIVPSVQSYFDDPSTYLNQPLTREVRRAALQTLGLNPGGARILDVGCGDGSLSLPLAPVAAELTLIDFSATMIREARRKAEALERGRVNVIEGDFMTAKLTPGFDLILCLGVLAHVQDLAAALTRLAALANEGGIVVTQLTDADTLLGRVLWVSHRARRSLSAKHALLRLGVRAMSKAAASCGLTTIRTRRYSLLLPGFGRLPRRFVRAVEMASIHDKRLAKFGAEALVVFRRDLCR